MNKIVKGYGEEARIDAEKKASASDAAERGDYERKGGLNYIYGTAGSLVMICRKCDKDHFRDAHAVLVLGHKEYCVWCGQELVPAQERDYDAAPFKEEVKLQ